MALVLWLLPGLQPRLQRELGARQPLPLPGSAAPLPHQVKGREKGVWPPQTIASLWKWPKEQSGAILVQERLLQVMALCPCHPESFVAGDEKTKLRVRSSGLEFPLRMGGLGTAFTCPHRSLSPKVHPKQQRYPCLPMAVLLRCGRKK